MEGWVRLGIFALGALAGAIGAHYHDMSAHVQPMDSKLDQILLESREFNVRVKMLHPELFNMGPRPDTVSRGDDTNGYGTD
jgi:hypothetical protein